MTRTNPCEPDGRRLSRRALTRSLAALPFLLANGSTRPTASATARPWHHTDTGFRNPPGSPERGGDFGEWLGFFVRHFFGREEVVLPKGHILPHAEARAGITHVNPDDALTWLGHASFLLRLDGRRVLTDPFLSEYASPLPPLGPKRFAPPGLGVDDLPPIDILLVSHNHYDHLDLPTIEALPAKEHVQVIVPLGLGGYFSERGYRRVREVDWYDEVTLDGLKLTAVPAIHFSRRTPFDRNRTLWTGYVIEGRSRRVYFAGDTAYGPVFQEIAGRIGKVDVALLPIGAYEPRHLMRATHASPEEAVRIGQDLGAKCLVAMHWGTIKLTDEPPFEPPGRFRTAAAAAGYGEDTAWLMRIGETRAL